MLEQDNMRLTRMGAEALRVWSAHLALPGHHPRAAYTATDHLRAVPNEKYWRNLPRGSYKLIVIIHFNLIVSANFASASIREVIQTLALLTG